MNMRSKYLAAGLTIWGAYLNIAAIDATVGDPIK